MNETPNTIKATGGFAKSEIWRQMMADIFDTNLIVPESYESSCLGACVLGLKAIGEIDDFYYRRNGRNNERSSTKSKYCSNLSRAC